MLHISIISTKAYEWWWLWSNRCLFGNNQENIVSQDGEFVEPPTSIWRGPKFIPTMFTGCIFNLWSFEAIRYHYLRSKIYFVKELVINQAWIRSKQKWLKETIWPTQRARVYWGFDFSRIFRPKHLDYAKVPKVNVLILLRRSLWVLNKCYEISSRHKKES
jgi:hypothetical protein